jgi:hypothetical protein
MIRLIRACRPLAHTTPLKHPCAEHHGTERAACLHRWHMLPTLGTLLCPKLPCLPGQYPDIIDQPFHQIKVLMRLALPRSSALVNQCHRIDLNLEFMLLFLTLGVLEDSLATVPAEAVPMTPKTSGKKKRLPLARPHFV